MTCNRSKQSLRIPPVPFKLKVPGLSAADLGTRGGARPREGRAQPWLGRRGWGETPYLCWFGHGLGLCSKHCGEEGNPVRLPCTPFPPFFPPNRRTLRSSQGSVCSPRSFSADASPSGSMTPQDLTQSQMHFSEDNGQTSQYPDTHISMGKELGTQKENGYDHGPHSSSRPCRALAQRWSQGSQQSFRVSDPLFYRGEN